MSEYIPSCGDIVWIDFDPSSGKEIQKRRPGLVVSLELFNKVTGFALFVPITSTVRGRGLEVELTGLETSGVALCEQVKSLHFKSRNIEFIEKAPLHILNEVTDRIESFIGHVVE